MKLQKLVIFLTAALLFQSHALSQTNVSVLMVYTDDARIAAGSVSNIETQIISAINDGNVALNNSNTNMQLSIAAIRELSVNEGVYNGSLTALLDDLTNPNDAVFDIVHQWRNQYAADMVYLVFENIDSNGRAEDVCGSSRPCDMTFRKHAFAVGQRGLMLVAPIVIHELGHVMGLRHDRTRDCGDPNVTCENGAFPYSHGHIDPIPPTGWGTIMAGGRPFPLVEFFSNPDLNHPNTNQQLGIVNFSDAARSLRNVRNIIAGFSDSIVGCSTGSGTTRCSYQGTYVSGTQFTWDLSPAWTIFSPYYNPGLPFTTTFDKIIFTHPPMNCPPGTLVTLQAIKPNSSVESGSFRCPWTGNLALSATARASSTFSGYSPSRINDGSTNTTVGPSHSWANNSGQSGPHWVELDFGKHIEFTKLVLYTSKYYELQDYSIQSRSGPGAPWETLVSVSNNTSASRTHVLNSTVAGSQLRVLGLRGPDRQPYYRRVNELEVYRYPD